MVKLLLLGACFVFSIAGAVVGEPISVGTGSALELPARYYRPGGEGPFPAVVVLHGSGGLWANDIPNGAMVRHFEEWAQLFAEEGYASLFVDSYTPRGLVEFRSRRPSDDPAIDDSICSPAYERPKDAYKALAFLQARPEIRANRIGLLGFSQGAETALSSLVSSSISKTNWTMSALKLNGETETRSFPAPVRLASPPGFAVAIVYYPGCGFYGYFGSSSGTSSNLFMPYAPTLMFHGSDDPLYSGNLYPEAFTQKSAAQAAAIGLPFNPLQAVVYPGAAHSFDEADLAGPESPNLSAKRMSRELALAWFSAYLKEPQLKITFREGGGVSLIWNRGKGIRHRILSGNEPSAPSNPLFETTASATLEDQEYQLESGEPRQFFRLENVLPAPF